MLQRSPHALSGIRLRRRLLVAVLVAAAAVRLAALYAFRDVETPRGDEAYYLATARSIAAGEGHPGSFRPPLHPAFLGAVFALFGEDVGPFAQGTARLAQVLVSLLLAAAVFSWVAGRFGPWPGLVSGAGVALLPSLVHYTHFLWSEGLAAALLGFFFFALDRFDRSERLGALAAAGLALGLAALTKEVWVYFGGAVILWLAWREGWRWRRAFPAALLFAALAAVAVLPWTLRNTQLHGQPVLVSTCRWFPVAVGNLLPEEGWLLGSGLGGEERRALPRGLSELEQEEHWRKVALEAIRAEQPGWIFKKVVRNVPRFFSLHSQQVRFLENGWVKPGPAGAYTLVATDVAGTLLVLLPGIAALAWVRGGRLQPLVVLAVLFLLGVHVLANAIPRFQVPVMPLFAVYLGPLLAGGGRFRAEGRLRRAAGWVAAALYLAAVLLRWNVSLGPALEAAGGL